MQVPPWRVVYESTPSKRARIKKLQVNAGSAASHRLSVGVRKVKEEKRHKCASSIREGSMTMVFSSFGSEGVVRDA